MKRFTTLLWVALFALLSASCENGENNELPPKPEKSCYKGTMTVDQNDGTFYTQSDVEVDYEILNGKLNFVMYKVKFASGMPLKLDMVVEGVSYEHTIPGTYTLSGDGLIPYAMGGPFEKYTITELDGSISDTEFKMEFMCGEYPVTYQGTK